jgi:beta-alanine degradation protein BauB
MTAHAHAPGTAIGTKLIDNARVTVWKWEFPKTGDNTGWHTHGHDYVVVPLMDGSLKIVTTAGDSLASMTAGAPYFRGAGIEHDVVNANAGAYAFIEIEVK